MSALPAGALRRRPLLSAAALLAVVPLAGCEDVPLDASEDGTAAEGPRQADPDEALLEEAVRAEAEMLPLLEAAPGRWRRLARQTAAVHQAHLRLLDEGRAAADGPTPRRTPTWRVVAAEEALAGRHARAAARATSGQFARVLASMAAASAQQAEVWRRTTGAAS